MARTYENFDVELIASGPTYEASFRSIPGEPRLNLAFPLEEHELTAFLAMFGKQQRRRMEAPEFTRVRAVGHRLFDSLFSGELSERLIEATSQAKQAGHGLRIRLDLSQAQDLGTLPWEYMYQPETDDFVSLSNWTPVVRYLHVSEPLPATPLDGPLRVLVMISDPIERRGTLDVEREWQQLNTALEGPSKRGEVELHRLPDGQLETLQVDLQNNDYHVFHFIGHGEYSEEHEDGVLALEDSRGREVHVPGSTVGTYLRDSLKMRLVVLNNCEGAAFESDPFTGSAQSLLRKGIPAIVAMQFEITDRAAIDFARGFYTSLGNGFPVDAALAEARKVIRGGPTRIEFGSPVLYMSANDGILFTRSEEVLIPDETEESDTLPTLAPVGAVEETVADHSQMTVDGDETEDGAADDTVAAIVSETAPAEPRHQETKVDVTRSSAVEGAADTDTTPPEVEQIATDRGDQPPPDRRAWVIASLALGAILTVVLMMNIFGGDEPGSDTTEPTGIETTLLPQPSPFVSWSRVSGQPSLGGEGAQVMHDVLAVEQGWIAVGTERIDEQHSAAAWTSTDGEDWTRLPDDAFTGETAGDTEMRSVVQLGSQLVAVGVTTGDGRDAAVWTSVDGNQWSRVAGDSLGGPGDQFIRGLTVWDGGLVAVGWEVSGEGTNGAIWTSSNGVDWVRVADPGGELGGDGAQRVHDAVAGGPGLVAVGDTNSGDFDAAVWVSADGDVWERVEGDQAGFSGPGAQLVNVVRSGAQGLIAAGFDSTLETGRDAAVWLSADGETWTRVGDREVFGGEGDQEIHGLAGVGSGWVAAGWTHDAGDKNAAIWASDDAVTWRLVEDAEAGLDGPDVQQVESVTAAGVTVVAVGIDGGSQTQDAAVWVGRPAGQD